MKGVGTGKDGQPGPEEVSRGFLNKISMMRKGLISKALEDNRGLKPKKGEKRRLSLRRVAGAG